MQREQCQQKIIGQSCSFDVECRSLRCVNKMCEKDQPRFLRQQRSARRSPVTINRSSTPGSPIGNPNQETLASSYKDENEYYDSTYDESYTGNSKLAAILAGVLVPIVCIGACVAVYCYWKIRYRMIATLPQTPKKRRNMNIEPSIHNIQQIIEDQKEQAPHIPL